MPLRRRGFLTQALRIGALAAAPATAGAASHREGDVFVNPPGSPERGGGFGEWAGFLWRGYTGRPEPDSIPDGHVLPPQSVREGMAAAGDRLTWLGHSTFLIRLAGVTLLTDPFLTSHASPIPPLGPRRFTPPALAPEAVPPVDVLLLSHNHYDHLDRPTLERLSGRGRTSVVLPLGVGRYVHDLGFGRLLEMDWEQTVELHGITVTAVPAIHFSARSLFDRNRTLWCGFIVRGGGRTLYVAGDTTYGPVFADIGRRHGPVDVALVPIGAYEPRHLMRGSHCTPEEAVMIGRDLGAGRLVAKHWGTIRLTDEPPFEPPDRFRAAASAAGFDDQRCRIPAIGQTLPL